jgi:CDP-glucose 4,6-dehydratase
MTFNEVVPDYLFHLAAQPLVSTSYKDPLGTINVNVIGTLNLLTTALKSQNTIGVTIAATDKIYLTTRDRKPFIESDPLGGEDPYSASKAATEILIKSIAKSCNPFHIPVTTIRAGNVIGFGDFAENRLVPDIWRSVESGISLKIRNKDSVRPWQFITDCLSAYLFAAKAHVELRYEEVSTEYNIGTVEQVTVSRIVDIFAKVFGCEIPWDEVTPDFKENSHLLLNSTLAQDTFGWSAKYSIEKAVEETAMSFREFLSSSDMSGIVSSTVKRDFLT